MMKNENCWRQTITPKEFSVVTGKSENACRRDFRKWKLEEGLTLSQYVTIELASRKSGIPYENLLRVVNHFGGSVQKREFSEQHPA